MYIKFSQNFSGIRLITVFPSFLFFQIFIQI
nr:MAG TPA: hypothetical protein [Caudoviricetes sp.]